jgi:Flp pilus assembly pilin Flp
MNRFAKGGAAAVEYGLIVAAISVAILTIVNVMSAQLIQTISSIPTQLDQRGSSK